MIKLIQRSKANDEQIMKNIIAFFIIMKLTGQKRDQ